jgi:hypothetical protein
MGIVNNVHWKDVVSMLKFLNDSGGDVIGRSSGGGRSSAPERRKLCSSKKVQVVDLTSALKRRRFWR